MERSNVPAVPGTAFVFVNNEFERIGKSRKNTSEPPAVSFTKVAKKTAWFERLGAIALLPLSPRGFASSKTELISGFVGSGSSKGRRALERATFESATTCWI